MIILVPKATPVASPVIKSIEAIDGARLVHTPPGVAFVYKEVLPIQINVLTGKSSSFLVDAKES